MSDDLATLVQALSLLETLARHDEKALITVVLPRQAWASLFYQLSKRMVELSVENGHGGIVVRFPAPEGKSYDNGFWCHGCWIEGDGDK